MSSVEQSYHGTPGGPHALARGVGGPSGPGCCSSNHPPSFALDRQADCGLAGFVLMLIEPRVLRAPLLVSSLFFKQHRSRLLSNLYYPRAGARSGDWGGRIAFLLEGVESQAGEAAALLTTPQGAARLFCLRRQPVEPGMAAIRPQRVRQRVFIRALPRGGGAEQHRPSQRRLVT